VPVFVTPACAHYQELHPVFSLPYQSDKSTSAYDALANQGGVATLGTGQGTNKGGSAEDKNKTKDGIVSGGSKQTNFYINIDSVGKEITINVDKTETGVTQLGDKVREELLRVINSINQIQTT